MGMSGTALHWGEPFLQTLRRDFDLIAYDHRGVGASSRLEGAVTIAQMAEDAAGLLDALELDSAHVLGISMGGMIAQELALAHPERVRTLTLGCTYCGGRGQLARARGARQRLTEAMRPATASARCGPRWEAERLAGLGRRRGRLRRASSTIAERRAVAVPVIDGADCSACIGPRHLRRACRGSRRRRS